jgi:hypothetical protein
MAAPDGFEHYDTGLADDMRQTFHEAKLTPAQAQHVHDKFVERMMGTAQEQFTAGQQQNEVWENELRQEYGTAFDDRVGAARAAIREFGSPELAQQLEASGMGSNPHLVRLLSKVGMQLGSGPQFKDAESSGSFGTTPEMAKEQIAAIRSNPALMDKGHPEHKVLNEKLTRLTELAFGNDPVAASITVG